MQTKNADCKVDRFSLYNDTYQHVAFVPSSSCAFSLSRLPDAISCCDRVAWCILFFSFALSLSSHFTSIYMPAKVSNRPTKFDSFQFVQSKNLSSTQHGCDFDIIIYNLSCCHRSFIVCRENEFDVQFFPLPIFSRWIRSGHRGCVKEQRSTAFLVVFFALRCVKNRFRITKKKRKS